MRAHRPTGWNTWDYRGFNRLVHLRSGRVTAIVQYAFWDERVQPADPQSKAVGMLHEQLRWAHARRIGPHAPLGLPASLDIVIGHDCFRADALCTGDHLHLKIQPQTESALRIVVSLLAPEGEPVTVDDAHEGRFGPWKIVLGGAGWPSDYFLNTAYPYAIAPPGIGVTFKMHYVRSPGRVKPVSTGRPVYDDIALRGGGALGEAPEAMMRAVNWNTHYDTRRRLMSSPVSRDWCIDWRGPIVFGWDSFFAALMAGCESAELARANVEAALAGVDALGFVPNYYMAHGAASLDRSMPCLGAYVVWKLEQADPDVGWLGKVYPRLKRWHRFWMRHRNGRRDGLLSWGSNAEPRYAFPQLLPYNPSLQHTAKCAMYESGLDNSPLYDDVPFNEAACTLELADVMLNSYYALDCECLARIAACLGRGRDAAAYSRELSRMRELINASLWDEEAGIYKNLHWDGRHSPRLSPGSFFPLLAGVADRRRAKRLVEEHLLNEAEFWGPFVLPSIARCDPAFRDNDYWRGRIWGPFNFLVAEGLRRYRYDEVACAFAKRSLDLFLRNWQGDGGVYENYNVTTGEGGDVWNAARLYHWGGLLAYTGVQELIDSELGGYLRFGSVHLGDARVSNFQLGGARYDVALSDGLEVKRNGEPYLACSTRAIVRLPLADARAPLEITASTPARLSLQRCPAMERSARINGERLIDAVVQGDVVTVTW